MTEGLHFHRCLWIENMRMRKMISGIKGFKECILVLVVSEKRMKMEIFFKFNLFFFNFTILCWFCHISKWIHHRWKFLTSKLVGFTSRFYITMPCKCLWSQLKLSKQNKNMMKAKHTRNSFVIVERAPDLYQDICILSSLASLNLLNFFEFLTQNQ